MRVVIAMPRMSTDPEPTVAQSKYMESLARAGAGMRWVELNDPEQAVQDALTCDGLLLRAFLAADKPVLGICRGIQVMNAVLGGDLYQDIKPFEHLPHNDHWAKVHTVTVRRGTLLSRILGQDTVLVNSQHHQAVDRVAPGFTLAALSEDGIVEAIEKPDARFCLGVQWHPEWLSDADPAMQSLFDAFVNACSK